MFALQVAFYKAFLWQDCRLNLFSGFIEDPRCGVPRGVDPTKPSIRPLPSPGDILQCAVNFHAVTRGVSARIPPKTLVFSEKAIM